MKKHVYENLKTLYKISLVSIMVLFIVYFIFQIDIIAYLFFAMTFIVFFFLVFFFIKEYEIWEEHAESGKPNSKT